MTLARATYQHVWPRNAERHIHDQVLLSQDRNYTLHFFSVSVPSVWYLESQSQCVDAWTDTRSLCHITISLECLGQFSADDTSFCLSRSLIGSISASLIFYILFSDNGDLDSLPPGLLRLAVWRKMPPFRWNPLYPSFTLKKEEVTSVKIYCISNTSHGVIFQETVLFFGVFDHYEFLGREAGGFIVWWNCLNWSSTTAFSKSSYLSDHKIHSVLRQTFIFVVIYATDLVMLVENSLHL